MNHFSLISFQEDRHFLPILLKQILIARKEGFVLAQSSPCEDAVYVKKDIESWIITWRYEASLKWQINVVGRVWTWAGCPQLISTAGNNNLSKFLKHFSVAMNLKSLSFITNPFASPRRTLDHWATVQFVSADSGLSWHYHTLSLLPNFCYQLCSTVYSLLAVLIFPTWRLSHHIPSLWVAFHSKNFETAAGPFSRALLRCGGCQKAFFLSSQHFRPWFQLCVLEQTGIMCSGGQPRWSTGPLNVQTSTPFDTSWKIKWIDLL